MTVLITGVNGFIGKHLAAYLLNKKKCKVIGVGRTPAAFTNEEYSHIQADITNPNFLNDISEEIECVVHLAQSKWYKNFPDKANDIFSVNVKATFDLLEWSRKKNISAFIFTSSGNVYAPKNSAFKESDSLKPSSFYGETKLIGEQLVRYYSSFFKSYILRLFTVYGPGQQNMLVSNLIQSVQNEKPIILASGKGIYINPVFITDLLFVMDHLIFLNEPNISAVMNIAGDEIISLDKMVEQTEEKLKKKAKTITTEAQPSFLVGDNSLLKSNIKIPSFSSFSDNLVYLI